MTNLKFSSQKLLLLASKHCITITNPILMKAMLYEFNVVLPEQIKKFQKLDFSQYKPKYLPYFIKYKDNVFRPDTQSKKTAFQDIFLSNNKNKIVKGYILLNSKRKIGKY